MVVTVFCDVFNFSIVAMVLSYLIANLFNALSAASPNSNDGILGFGYFLKVVVRNVSASRICLTEFVVGF